MSSLSPVNALLMSVENVIGESAFASVAEKMSSVDRYITEYKADFMGFMTQLTFPTVFP